MDSLDNEFNVQVETKQMQKLQMYQKLVLFTILKFKWSIIAVFLATVLLGICCRYVQFKRSHHSTRVVSHFSIRPVQVKK